MTAVEVEHVGLDLNGFDHECEQYLKRTQVPGQDRVIILDIRKDPRVILLPSQVSHHGIAYIVPVRQYEASMMDILMEDPKRDVDISVFQQELSLAERRVRDYMRRFIGKFDGVDTVIHKGKYYFSLTPLKPKFYISVPRIQTNRCVEIPGGLNIGPNTPATTPALWSGRYDYTKVIPRVWVD